SQTGLGKTGRMFGFEHDPGVMPDIMVLSKHFGGGLPISAVVTSAAIADRAVANGYFATRSHATDPILCAAGGEPRHRCRGGYAGPRRAHRTAHQGGARRDGARIRADRRYPRPRRADRH